MWGFEMEPDIHGWSVNSNAESRRGQMRSNFVISELNAWLACTGRTNQVMPQHAALKPNGMWWAFDEKCNLDAKWIQF